MRSRAVLVALACAAMVVSATVPAPAQQVTLVTKSHDPNGFPRPGNNHANVPLRTSYYIELKGPNDNADPVDPTTVTLSLTRAGGTVNILSYQEQFQPGYSGWIVDRGEGNTVAVYADSTVPLLPSTQYTVHLTAASVAGAQLPGGEATWKFTTEAAPATHSLTYNVNLAAASTTWEGGFFTGFCKPSFNTSFSSNRIQGYDLMAAVTAKYPRAWSLQRDWWITGFGFSDAGWWVNHPNIVRERETRHILHMKDVAGGTELRLERGFHASEQYGIPWGRDLSVDYNIGDEVLIADGSYNNARVFVVAMNDVASTMLVTTVPTPAEGWRDYLGSPTTVENPDAPGLFAPGGLYLRKFDPVGTQHYYWGRMDKEWDAVHGQYGRRLVVNFCDGAGDLAIDGGEFTTAKDLFAQREATYQITSRTLSRYGPAALNFLYSVGNEVDLAAAFWRNAGWDEFQRFYDYSVDGVLRAVEDHGYDSSQVMVGGVEIGAIFGASVANPILGKVLGHCSPTGTYSGALPLNAAYADPRLAGKLSQRVVDLCSANGGAGSPMDFISIHGYNRSSLFAAKMKAGKDLALSIDPTYYADLWVGSHECCPDWAPPADVAAHEAYLGNGYFSTWCADVARRQILQAVSDNRYGFGETILTFWPWVDSNFAGLNGATEILSVDDNHDGVADRSETIAFPLLHFLGLMASTDGADYRALPNQVFGAHVVSGYSAKSATDVRVMVYSHNELDTQSRSGKQFEVTVNVNDLPWAGPLQVQQYRVDKDHNSVYRLALELRDRKPFVDARPTAQVYTPQELEHLRALSDMRVTDEAYMTPTAGSIQLVVPVGGNGANFIVINSAGDAESPSVTMTSLAGGPTNLSPIPVTVFFSEPVTGFDAGDITPTNAVVTGFSGSGANYEFDLVPITLGTVTADIAADAASDGGGNGNTAAAQFSREFDDAPPAVSLSSIASDPVIVSPIPVTVTFTEAVYGFTAANVLAGDAEVESFSGSGASYSFDLVPTGEDVTADIPDGAATDAAGNGNTASPQFERSFIFAPEIIGHPEPVTVYEGQSVTFDVVLEGTAPFTYQWKWNGAFIPGETDPTITADPALRWYTGVISVVVSNAAGSVESNGAQLTVLPAVPPTITEHPQPLTVYEGEPAEFSVSATGTGPLSYVWRWNGMTIIGETDLTISTDAARIWQRGVISCRVSNFAGSALSDGAHFIIRRRPPVITEQPQSATVQAGDPVSFSVTATGSDPLHYQWRWNGLPLGGANDPTVETDSAEVGYSGTLTCVVSNSVGSVTSAPAVLTVTP